MVIIVTILSLVIDMLDVFTAVLYTNICRQVRGACQGFSKVKIKIKSRSSHAIVISGYRSFLVESIQTSFDQIYQYYYFDAVCHNVTS